MTTPLSTADLDQLLERTSRTFALSIPMLPEPTRSQVTLAYLLFRIADTFEDAASWPKERRVGALDEFAELVALADGGEVDCDALAERARGAVDGWTGEIRAGETGSDGVGSDELPSSHEGYLELLEATPQVLCRYLELPAEARRIVGHHTVRTARGMADFVRRADGDGRLVLEDEEDLVRYCYVVAGIVGELLTDLFVLGRPALAEDAGYLESRAATFGEALQLVNILKDAEDDAEEGRRFLPPGLGRDVVFRRARRDLETASEYVLCLQRAQLAGGAERGLVAFTALPVRLAWATLEKVEEHGPGSKVSRPTVYRLAADLERALDEGTPAVVPPAGHPAA